MESKAGHRNSEHHHGNMRLAPPPHSNPSTAGPTPKNSGMAELLYKSNQKYVKYYCLLVAALIAMDEDVTFSLHFFPSVRKETLSSRSITSSPIEKKDKEETVFQVSYPSAFSKLIASRQVSPLLTSQSWSPR